MVKALWPPGLIIAWPNGNVSPGYKRAGGDPTTTSDVALFIFESRALNYQIREHELSPC